MGESDRRRPPRKTTFAARNLLNFSAWRFGSMLWPSAWLLWAIIQMSIQRLDVALDIWIGQVLLRKEEASSPSAFGYQGPMQMRSVLIVFAGLPGTGKSSVARELDRKLDAVWSRIDSIEQAIRDSAGLPGSIDDAGYRAAFAVAGDNLRLGRAIVADSVASGRPCGRG